MAAPHQNPEQVLNPGWFVAVCLLFLGVRAIIQWRHRRRVQELLPAPTADAREAASRYARAIAEFVLPPWTVFLALLALDAGIAISGVLAVASTHTWETFVREKVQAAALQFISDPDRAFTKVTPTWRLQFRRAGVISSSPVGRMPQTAEYFDSLLAVAADGFVGPPRSSVEVTYTYEDSAHVNRAAGTIGLDTETRITFAPMEGDTTPVQQYLTFGSYDSSEVLAGVTARIQGRPDTLPIAFVKQVRKYGIGGARAYFMSVYRVSFPIRGATTTAILHRTSQVPVDEPLNWAAAAPTANLTIKCICPHRRDWPRLMLFGIKRSVDGPPIEQAWESAPNPRSVPTYTWSSSNWLAPGEGVSISWSATHE